MNNSLVCIGNSEISIKEYKNQRVVTFKDIDLVHGRPDGTARKRFSDNKKHFIDGVDFFKISPSEFRTTIGEMDARQQNDITLITEQGYLILVKSFTDDLAWEVQRQLVNSYFRKESTINRSELSPQMQMLMSMVETQAKQELEQKKQAAQIEQVKSTVNTMQEIFVRPIGDWQAEINKMVREISIKSQIPYQELWAKLYGELETTAKCSLKRLCENKKKRMETAGNTKTAVKSKTTKLSVVQDNQRLKSIFENIVKRYAMAYLPEKSVIA